MTKHKKALLFAILLATMTSTVALAGEIHLSAGAGMKEVLIELSEQFAKTHPGTMFIRNWGPSGTLALQIENGAPTDLFVSANEKWIYYLREKNLLDNSKVSPFAWNSIVVIGNPALGISSMKELARLDRIALGNPDSAPAGEMALEAIRTAGIEKQLNGRLVRTRDVLESLMYAESGVVDASFVHLTEALTAKKAKILFTVPQNLYTRVPYTMGVTKKGASNVEVTRFYDYLKSPEARTILKRYGYALK
jgi:molybdate transport system substrate-binding protein